MAILTRRCKVLHIDPELLLTLLRQSHEAHCWRVDFGLPEDAQLVKLRLNDWLDQVEVLVSSSTFDEVPEAVEYPSFGPIVVRSERCPACMEAMREVTA